MRRRPAVRNYEDAKSLFKKARFPKRGKPLQNNTRLYKRGEDYAVRLHRTDVVTYHPDGSWTVNAGGWQTVTTADRINRYSPISMRSNGGTYYFVGPNQAIEVSHGDVTVDPHGHLEIPEHKALMA
jgi:hypothetical protein